MKKQEIQKLKNRSAQELRKDAVEMKEKIWDLRRQIASGKIKDVRARRALRRDLARMLTFARQHDLTPAAELQKSKK